MAKLLRVMILFGMLAMHAGGAVADQYDDCLAACDGSLAPCVEQARLTAGNVGEEESLIAACQKVRSDCIQVCRDAEVQPPQFPASPQTGSPQDQTSNPSPEPQSETLNGSITIYRFKD